MKFERGGTYKTRNGLIAKIESTFHGHEMSGTIEGSAYPYHYWSLDKWGFQGDVAKYQGGYAKGHNRKEQSGEDYDLVERVL